MLMYLQAALRPILIVTWAAALIVITAGLMASHWVSLPRPAIGQTLNIQPSDPPLDVSTRSRFPIRTLHVLYVDCPCSQRVLKHLLERTAVSQAHEQFVLVVNSQEARDAEPGTVVRWREQAVRQGFETELLTADELMQRYGVEASPLLLILDRHETVIYSGGYTQRKQGPAFQDVAIIDAALAGTPTDSLPLFGCAVSKRLQRIVDPLNLKY